MLRKGKKPCGYRGTQDEIEYCKLWDTTLDDHSEGMAAMLTADMDGDKTCEEVRLLHNGWVATQVCYTHRNPHPNHSRAATMNLHTPSQTMLSFVPTGRLVVTSRRLFPME